VQSTSFRSLFLSNLLILPHAADGTAKTDADVQRHSLPILEVCSRCVHSR